MLIPVRQETRSISWPIGWSRSRLLSALSVRELVIAGFMAAYVVGALAFPTGAWDAWAIWNLKARYFVAGVDPLHGIAAHSEYPILLPLAVALAYQVAGGLRDVGPLVVHGLIYLALLWLLRDNLWALCLVAIAVYPYALYQYADLALAVAFLGAARAYLRGHWLAAALCLGIGLHLKNEGLLMAGVFWLCWIVPARRLPWRALAIFAPFLLALVAFKLWVAVPNDVLSSGGVLERLTDAGRYWQIGVYAAKGLLKFGGAALPVLLIGVVLSRKPPALSVPLAAVLLVYIGYLMIYVITPHDLVWHLFTSHDRLVLQVFPALAFVLTRSPHMLAGNLLHGIIGGQAEQPTHQGQGTEQPPSRALPWRQ